MTHVRSSEESWNDVKTVLENKLGQNAPRIARLSEIRDDVRRLASAGIVTSPDFTLHNELHSDNILLLLGQLLDRRVANSQPLQLSQYEGFLLAASAYLHDIGMFFGEAQFREEVLPALPECLRVCPDDKCDAVAQYLPQLEGKPIPHQIRILHHLLGAYLLDRHGTSLFRMVSGGDKPHIIAICRGHRGSDLCTQECGCYRCKPEKTGPVRRDLLAGLLRLADALDFYPDRAPQEVLLLRPHDFLHSPVALRHWLNHCFAASVYPTPQDDRGNWYLDCAITYHLPKRELTNGRSYKEFLVPLFEAFQRRAAESDFNANKYPHELKVFLNVKEIRLRYEVVEETGAVELPTVIADAVRKSETRDATEFFEYLESKGPQDVTPRPAHPVMDRKAELQVFQTMLNGDDQQHRLMVLVGDHGQGKTLLVKQFERLASDAHVRCAKLDLVDGIDFGAVLDAIWHNLGPGNFPSYAARRHLPAVAGREVARHSQAELTQTFFADLALVEQEYRLLLLLDTFERGDPVLKSWIADELLDHVSRTDGIMVVIAGREWPKTNEYWKIHGYHFPLNGVRMRDYQEYAAARRVVLPEQEMQTIHKTTRGLPKLLAEHVEAVARETA